MGASEVLQEFGGLAGIAAFVGVMSKWFLDAQKNKQDAEAQEQKLKVEQGSIAHTEMVYLINTLREQVTNNNERLKAVETENIELRNVLRKLREDDDAKTQELRKCRQEITTLQNQVTDLQRENLELKAQL